MSDDSAYPSAIPRTSRWAHGWGSIRPEPLGPAGRWQPRGYASLRRKWRTGLSAFVTLVTGGLLIKGPQAAQDLSVGWRTAISLLAGLGLAAAVCGLWQALRAAAGMPTRVNLQAVVTEFGGVRQFEVVSARKAADALRWARVLVGSALVLLGATVIVWWWAPTSPTHLISVEQANDQPTLCGSLVSADDQVVRLQRSGVSKLDEIPFARITNLRVVDSC